MHGTTPNSSDIDAYYGELHRNELLLRERQLLEANSKALSEKLRERLAAEYVDIVELQALLNECKAAGGVNQDLIAAAETLISESSAALSAIQQALETLITSCTRKSESRLQALLSSAPAQKLKRSNVYLKASEYLLLNPVPAPDETPITLVEEKSSQKVSRAVRFEFSYILSAATRRQWLSRIEASLQDVRLPTAHHHEILHSALAQIESVCRGEDSSSCRISTALEVVWRLSILFRGNAVKDKGILLVFTSFLSALLSSLEKCQSEKFALWAAVVMEGIAASLGSNLKSLLISLLIPMLTRFDKACVPDFSSAMPSSNIFTTFVGALLEVGTIPTSMGWSWLVNGTRQLYLLRSATSSESTQELLIKVSKSMESFLRVSVGVLQRTNGTQLRALLRALQDFDAAAAAPLLDMLDVNTSLTLDNLPSFVIANRIFQKYKFSRSASFYIFIFTAFYCIVPFVLLWSRRSLWTSPLQMALV